MACILLCMRGGPSQFETFDPKPGHANGGATKAIATAVAGIQIAEGWPQRRQGDERHRPHPLDDQQGRQPPAGDLPAAHRLRPLGQRQAPEHRLDRGARARRPEVRPAALRQHRQSRAPIGARLPGREFDAFSWPDPPSCPPTQCRRPSAPRFDRRLDCSRNWKRPDFGQRRRAAEVEDHQKLYRQSGQDGPQPRHEGLRPRPTSPTPSATATAQTAFGQGCLLARRLVEAGVTFVEVGLNGWDTHQEQLRPDRQI